MRVPAPPPPPTPSVGLVPRDLNYTEILELDVKLRDEPYRKSLVILLFISMKAVI